MKRQVYVVGLGANLGTPLASLRFAAAVLARQPGVEILAWSPVYRSEAVGPPQPDYLNAAVAVSTSLPPLSLLERLQAIEQGLGRRRTVRWGARSLDLDLLWSPEPVILPSLRIPHRHLHERWWALQPLLDVLGSISANRRWDAGVGCGGVFAKAADQHVELLAELGGRRSAVAPASELMPGMAAELSTVRFREDGNLLTISLVRRWSFETPADLLMTRYPVLWRHVAHHTTDPTPVIDGSEGRLHAATVPDLPTLVGCHLRLLSRGRWPLCATICSAEAFPPRVRTLTGGGPPRWLELADLEIRSDGIELCLREAASGRLAGG